MYKRFPKQNTFSEETPIYHSNAFRKFKIYESHNIMKIIMAIKMQAQLEARYIRRLMPQKFKLEKEESNFWQMSREEGIDLDSKSVNDFRLETKKPTKIERKLIQSVVKEECNYEDEEDLDPDLLEKFFGKLIKSAEILKKELKKAKGLDVNEEFVMVNVHVCEYCGRKFEKPCSLGGHISKLHSDDKRRGIKLGEYKEKMESKVAKRQ